MMNEQQVREAIDGMIEHMTARMNEVEATDVPCLGFAIDTLIHLKHTLRICGCPPEAYGAKP